MSLLDRAIAAITPPESEQGRAEARQRAEQCANQAPWLLLVLDHHRQVDDAFAAVKAASDGSTRQKKLKELAVLLTAHSIAEEGVIYPALSDSGENGHATMAYTEQSAAKLQIGLLERLDPMSQDFEDKLGHLEGAVKHHVYQEEGTWFPELIEDASAADHKLIEQRYREEFDRYFRGGSVGKGSACRWRATFQRERSALKTTLSARNWIDDLRRTSVHALSSVRGLA
ncbi:hemerythrin domain-containing protein [Novosphingobium sp. Gsoil 351]|uniref:hemerythrin domain-containing protein n=1 Tax=Novosphingobium sp. Gsoil 351 TaxID=2675225 RepID=UPI0012B4F8FC|nr:hemerythrin domain-containing protein [Novosphingobium sp. Gsoil 351]QGN55773.1 hemerythrin domain-containing protein [Novosphingobium sp. Gsoil 351]